MNTARPVLLCDVLNRRLIKLAKPWEIKEKPRRRWGRGGVFNGVKLGEVE